MIVPASSQHLFPRLSQSMLTQAKKALAKTSTANSGVADKLLSDFQYNRVGALYRAVGDMRTECSRLQYSGQLRGASASVIAASPAHQSVYSPDWMPAVGFLISNNATITAASPSLFLETPTGQSSADIHDIRTDIVSRLKQGDASSPHQSTRFYAPRQSGVNESLINYAAEDVAAYAIPLTSAEQLIAPFITEDALTGDTHTDDAPTDDAHTVDAHKNDQAAIDQTPTNQAPIQETLARAKHLRLATQLAYAVAKLGVKPVYCFGNGSLTRLDLSAAQWTVILSNLNALSNNADLLSIAHNPVNLDRKITTGLTAATEQLAALEKAFDLQDVKHIGGALTRIPVDIAMFAFGRNSG